jgi:hypothetical protein
MNAAMPGPQGPIDPGTIYAVCGGPLQGGMATIVAVEQDGRRVHAIVQVGRTLTPPVVLETSLLGKRLGPSIPWWSRCCTYGTVLSLFVFLFMRSPIALAVAAALFPVMLGHYGWCVMESRRLKTCPTCRGWLDPDTWSHCERCGWDRPMPSSLPAELKACRKIVGDPSPRPPGEG